jgi:ABC-2 type transport system ATP-binding protein
MPGGSSYRIVVKNLCKTYRSSTKANRSVSLSVRPSELMCLMGRNGAGKTTLMRQVAGLLRPTSGEIEVCGVSVTANPRGAKGLIGYQPQHFSGLSELTFREVLMFLGRLRGLREHAASDRLHELAELLDVAEVLQTRVQRLSGGYRQLLGLSLALLASPPVLLLDEPTAGLDPVHRRRVWRVIHQAREGGAAVLVTSHHLDEIEDHMDRYAIMVAGRIVKSGELESLRQEARSDGAVVARVFPRRGFEGALQDELDLAGLPSSYDEAQRCYVVSLPRAAAGDLVDLYIARSAEGIRGFSIDRCELESVYLRAEEEGNAHGG